MTSNITQEDRQRILLGVVSLFVGIALLIAKFVAFEVTDSRAILSDALESIANVFAAAIGLVTIYIASKPADKDHPYGHGKAEYFSVAFEGGFISFAAILIIYDSIHSFLSSNVVKEIDFGIIVVAVAGAINGAVGLFLKLRGRKLKSLALVGGGEHLITDFLTSVGLILGLFMVRWTGWMWIDSLIALSFGLLLAYTGWTLVRKSLSGLMDAEDMQMITQLGKLFYKQAFPGIIRIHHTRVIRSGRYHHVDAHIVVPEYWEVQKAHDETVRFENAVIKAYEFDGEMHLHLDPCRKAYCEICDLKECPIRKKPFVKRLEFTLDELTDPHEPEEFQIKK